MNEMSVAQQLAQVVGRELRFWRSTRNLTRERLAEMTGLSVNTIGRYERGYTVPTFVETWLLVSSLGVEMRDFVDRVESSANVMGIAPTGTPETKVNAIDEKRIAQSRAAGSSYYWDLFQLALRDVDLSAAENPRMADTDLYMTASNLRWAFRDADLNETVNQSEVLAMIREFHTWIREESPSIADVRRRIVVFLDLFGTYGDAGVGGPPPPLDAAAHTTGEMSMKERFQRDQDEAAERQD